MHIPVCLVTSYDEYDLQDILGDHESLPPDKIIIKEPAVPHLDQYIELDENNWNHPIAVLLDDGTLVLSDEAEKWQLIERLTRAKPEQRVQELRIYYGELIASRVSYLAEHLGIGIGTELKTKQQVLQTISSVLQQADIAKHPYSFKKLADLYLTIDEAEHYPFCHNDWEWTQTCLDPNDTDSQKMYVIYDVHI